MIHKLNIHDISPIAVISQIIRFAYVFHVCLNKYEQRKGSKVGS